MKPLCGWSVGSELPAGQLILAGIVQRRKYSLFKVVGIEIDFALVVPATRYTDEGEKRLRQQ